MARWATSLTVSGGLFVAGCSLLANLDDLKGEGASKHDGGAGTGSGGGGTGNVDGGAGSAGDAATGCPPGQKSCGADCVKIDDPTTGCAQASCAPCSTAHAAAICVGGACEVSQCANGFEDCNADGSDGCETDLKNDATSCGTCGQSCALPNAKVSCVQGQCQSSGCVEGFADCNQDPKDGCEVNLGADPTNCGACANACPAPTGKSAVCEAATCGVSNCAAPLADCDKDSSQSCETDLSKSTASCGFCGNGCAYANASAACQSGSCALGQCATGFGNCDDNVANGCETALASSTEHCGACGKSCAGGANAAATCSAGSCGLKCNAGWANCDGNLANGCETNVLTSVAHCGACGAACSTNHATPACGGGGCSVTCAAGWGNCNGSPGDGCETVLNTVTNCGACGKSVGATGDSNSGWGTHTLRRIVGSGNTLKVTSCYWNSDWEECADKIITLSGATASGDSNAGWGTHTLRRIVGSGSTLKVTSCYWNSDWEECAEKIITLTGVTAAGDSNSGWGTHTLRRIVGSGNTLKVTSCYWNSDWEECADKVITLSCAP
ncbi:MAG: hypothetical protein KJ015_14515 [Myxococcales bacterium]|nr:hypothetical protein [Myxococcales bacterium]